MIDGPFHTYRRIHFTSGNVSFLFRFVCNQPEGPDVAPACLMGFVSDFHYFYYETNYKSYIQSWQRYVIH